MRIGIDEARQYFAHPSQQKNGISPETLPVWAVYYASGGVCLLTHPMPQDGLWMVHIGVMPGAWGKVKVEMDGNQSITAVQIDDELMKPDQKDKLQGGLKDALNEAIKKAQKKMMEQMKSMGGFDIPGMK